MKETAANAGKNESASLQKYTASASQAMLQPKAEIDPQNGLMLQRMCRGCRSYPGDLNAELAAMPFPARRSAAMSLQKSLGNRFVQGLAVQAKLAINRSDDPYEREADRIAEHVMNMPEPAASGHAETKSSIQRMGLGGEDATPYFEKSIQQVRGNGQQLPVGVKRRMEDSFGAEFGVVRVHVDAHSDRLNQSIQARAFTIGQDIFFKQGNFNPEDRSGLELIAHELTHVIQQHKSSSIESIQRDAHVTLPSWSRSKLRSIQIQLKRLGLYRLDIDETFGPTTESALVEAFGGDAWRHISPDSIISRLTRASPPGGTRGEHRLRYGEMFRDGILDMTLGVGFDEASNHLQVISGVRTAMAARRFREDRARAVQIFSASGRVISNSTLELFFVRDGILTYTPPAGAARRIHAVIRFITSPTGSQGQEAATAFREGMVHSDVAFYSGHGRYGSGPDFDRNMRFELLDDHGRFLRQIDGYRVLERELSSEGRGVGRGAWQQFLWRVNHNRIRVIGSNLGNVYINPANLHRTEFGAQLMYWVLNRGGASPVTGRGSVLTREVQAARERRYRLWVFDGCRTQDYVRSIRSTPGLDTASTDLMVSRRTLYWPDNVATLVAFLDSVLGQQSAEKIIQNMDSKNVTLRPSGSAGVSFSAQGMEDNPIIR